MLTNRMPEMPKNELSDRISKLRAAMEKHEADVLIFSSFSNFEYVVGHFYTGWELHAARPMYSIITQEDFIVVCSPSDQKLLESREHNYRLVYYTGFQPEATQTVINVVKEMGVENHHRIVIDYGQDLSSIGNLLLIDSLRDLGRNVTVKSAASLVWSVRKCKSHYEAELKRRAFAITDAGFDWAVQRVHAGITEDEMQREIKIGMLKNGAERVDSMAIIFGRGNFVFNQMMGSDRKLEDGHFVWADIYNTFYGYPSDRCRTARCGQPTDEEQLIYQKSRRANIRTCESIRQGMTGRDVFNKFEQIWADAKLPPIWAAAGRIGHASGRDVLEPISIASWSEDVIEPGMILHIEPKLEYNGGVYQFEEVVYVLEDGVEFLTNLSPEEIPVVPVK